MQNNHNLSREQTQKLLERNKRENIRPEYKLIGGEREGQCVTDTQLAEYLRKRGNPSMSGSMRSWRRRLNSKQFNNFFPSQNKHTPVTKTVRNRKTRTWDTIPLNDTDKTWK